MFAEPFGIILNPTALAGRYVGVGLFGTSLEETRGNQERLCLEAL